MIFISFLVFLFGLVLGSFLNSLIYRLEKRKSFWRGRSFCPKCGQILSWLDLIPIFSFLFLKGKCRYCDQKISLQYPLVELATALLFLFVYLFGQTKTPLFLFFDWLFVSFLIIIFVYDLKHYLIPEEIIYPAIFLALFYQFLQFFFNQEIKNLLYLGLAILPALFFLSLIFFSRGKWLGFGDFQLAIFLGLFLAWPKILVALFFSFFFGAIIGLGLIFFQKKSLKSQIPFAPFLVSGTLISLFWGENIVDFYLALLR